MNHHSKALLESANTANCFECITFRAWYQAPDNPEHIARRNDFMGRFDRGAVLEHFAFPRVLVTGVMLTWLAGWSIDGVSWLTLKRGIVLLVFMSMEAVDYYISHMGGDKHKIRISGDMRRYERMTRCH